MLKCCTHTQDKALNDCKLFYETPKCSADKSTFCEGWVDPGWLSDTHPATLSLLLLKRAEGENKTKTLAGQDKDKKIPYQSLSQYRFGLGKINLICH